MGYSNGQLESSQGSGKGEKGDPGLPGIGFNLDDHGNFDLDSKRLTDVANPVNAQDAATKKYLDDSLKKKADENEVLLLDGSQAMTGNLDLNNKNKIVHLDYGSNPRDAVNYSQLITHTANHRRDYQLALSFDFYRDFGYKGEVSNTRLKITRHRHLNFLSVGAIEGGNTGFKGEAWSSLKMTNTLGRGIYTAVLETFSIDGSVLLNDETLLQSVRGDDHFKVLTFSHDWRSNSGRNTPHSKPKIRFSSDG